MNSQQNDSQLSYLTEIHAILVNIILWGGLGISGSFFNNASPTQKLSETTIPPIESKSIAAAVDKSLRQSSELKLSKRTIHTAAPQSSQRVSPVNKPHHSKSMSSDDHA
ncbi:hypothetical protein MNBD_PLANCTO02-2776 [hydrothermal vent metagenome]|uniref:Uncharacterized protein n=1 Tax=hydrothermal vent metagenome TaxID=652676 RepID=A0A3B1DEY2_9ZZZZ